MSHEAHNMHENSLLAYYQGQREMFDKRELDVLLAVRSLGRGTDREIMIALGKGPEDDPNYVRPRISTLVNKKHVLEQVGKKQDPVTRKTVRVVALRQDPRAPQAQFDFSIERKAS